ncbi:11191_t:CDS:1 [Ambispora gerdemannii]|uniref:11191_t:CDS:1 n=1 Tax=Ambispora gerdemannii TaxID=144530 RepID=A0A9N8W014_9GLOM|nr:11191_t:CDS:1 [Ambispora gerdemannii]
MPLFEQTNQKNNNQTDNCGFEKPTNQSANQSAANQSNQPTETKSTGLMNIIGQCLPFAPLVFEQFTGQKVPQLSGTMADIQNAIQQVQFSLQTVVNNQQQLSQRITSLETNANQHLANLTNQFKSLKLTHTKEQKQIELHSNNENQEY